MKFTIAILALAAAVSAAPVFVPELLSPTDPNVDPCWGSWHPGYNKRDGIICPGKKREVAEVEAITIPAPKPTEDDHKDDPCWGSWHPGYNKRGDIICPGSV
ncbi:hypothetical protein BGX29_006645 [Mortierella sp. GBA35]|nr:hypothetical protein BGX29_006645 [Mortierella sp. GBA35]KAG0215390.1 hypothetical protein BGX33_001239 [Mortierella sp. NVP41]